MRVVKHPSGRPIRKREHKELSFARVPRDGPLLPRLRETERDLSLVGFHHRLEHRDDDEQV